MSRQWKGKVKREVKTRESEMEKTQLSAHLDSFRLIDCSFFPSFFLVFIFFFGSLPEKKDKMQKQNYKNFAWFLVVVVRKSCDLPDVFVYEKHLRNVLRPGNSLRP